jgi:hypothetical protein
MMVCPVCRYGSAVAEWCDGCRSSYRRSGVRRMSPLAAAEWGARRARQGAARNRRFYRMLDEALPRAACDAGSSVGDSAESPNTAEAVRPGRGE